jgi:hypothetical protein
MVKPKQGARQDIVSASNLFWRNYGCFKQNDGLTSSWKYDRVKANFILCSIIHPPLKLTVSFFNSANLQQTFKLTSGIPANLSVFLYLPGGKT